METRVVVAGLSTAALVALVLALGQSDRVSRPTNINGDSLGMDSETPENYQARARITLEEANEPAFAMITFTEALNPGEAGVLLEPIPRVNARLTDTAIVPLPEPVKGKTRADVLGNEPIPGVIVYAPGDVLRKVAKDSRVFAIEVLPPDAAWGRFGIRPVRF
ncbi:MAG: hypothetical protein Q4A92_01070 [Corynebacterium sp.]|nr:hypothetical protein [Corynebacterium sp.]